MRPLARRPPAMSFPRGENRAVPGELRSALALTDIVEQPSASMPS